MASDLPGAPLLAMANKYTDAAGSLSKQDINTAVRTPSDEVDCLSKSSVMHRTWKLFVGLAWSFFIVFEIAIGCDWLYSASPLCPYNPDANGAWFQQINCFCFGGFVLIWLLLAFRAIQVNEAQMRVPLVVALNIVSMGTIATGLATFTNWGGLCIDVLNVASPAAIWAEWMACGPLLIYITITIVDKPALSWLDIGLMTTFFLCLLTGFFIIPSQPLGSGQFWLFVSCVTYIPVLYLPWHKPWLLNPPMSSVDEGAERLKKMSGRIAQQVNLSWWLTFILPLYTVNYLVATWGGYGPDVTIAVYQVLSVLTKGLFAGLAMDVHLDLLRSTELQLLEERRGNDARRVFMKYIFHEVRTPLSSLAMGLSMLKDNKTIQESEGEPLLMMEMACEFMSETLDGVLNMQKIEEGKLVLEIANFSLKDMADKCAFMFKSSVLQKRLVIKTSISPLVPPLLVGDVHRVLHILSNLISNAIKFSPPDGKINIEANIHSGGGSSGGNNVEEGSSSTSCLVKFSVTDQGPGISAKNQALLFNNFVQIGAGSQQQGKGSGLGLSLVKQLVQLHNGQVGVVSKEGHGSTFFFIIPFGVAQGEPEPADFPEAAAVTTAPAAVALELRESASACASADKGQANAAAEGLPEILVVDDSSINSKMLTMLLKRKGVRTCTAENGQEALDLVLADPERFRVVLMDNLMPVMSGLEATRRLRASGFSSLICGLTGNVMEDDVVEYQLAGVDMVLTKPLKVDLLDALLAHAQQHGCRSRHAENLALVLGTEGHGAWVPKAKYDHGYTTR